MGRYPSVNTECSRCRVVLLWAVVVGLAAGAGASAQEPGGEGQDPVATGFRASMALTFLILAMGPLPLIPGFAALTAGRERRFKLELAAFGVAIAAAASVVAATIGVAVLNSWGVSRAALVLTTGLLLALIAFKTLFEVYTPRPKQPREAAAADAPPPTRAELAFAPLAFPMILPPFGIGILVVLLTLAEERGGVPVLAGLIAFVLALDFLAMIAADWIMKAPFIKHALLVVGSVVGVLQAALAVEAIADAIRDLNFF